MNARETAESILMCIGGFPFAERRRRMNITATEAIRPEHYYTVGKKQKLTEGNAPVSIREEAQIQRGKLVSPEEKYRELSGNREQRVQDWGR